MWPISARAEAGSQTFGFESASGMEDDCEGGGRGHEHVTETVAREQRHALEGGAYYAKRGW